MNTRRTDLNLLHIFRAIMEEENVSRAAERLSMTQPAVSNGLKRLRYVFDDELFIRHPGGMKPTQKAIDAWPQIHAALNALDDVIFPNGFDPQLTRTTFRISITDSLTPDLIPDLAVAFHKAAPLAQLQFHHHTNLTSGEELLKGNLDCAIGMFPRPSAGLKVKPLMTDDYVCVMRAGNPLATEELTAENFAAAAHVLMKPSGTGSGTVDHWLGLRGYTRDIAIVVNHFSEALRVVLATDLLTCLPGKYVELIVRNDSRVAIKPLPFESERILYKLAWHERTERIADQVWFRSMLLTRLL